ncbi:MAG: HDOD domain-containing protein [Candidatus Thiodiazotropha sp. (ex Myrtea sp. 'scaly one' KF741663)]|nr:HDOD domain-containing protein [Candidatus Thiodiazotropha sp. (ex Myrtea sp. 'scaly one' KF741663)]
MNDSSIKKRILFVDDEQNVLSGLRRSLRSQRKEWDMEFVGSGQDALAKADESHFDAVVTDMRMPGMDGAELLNRLAENHPHVVRVVLSGQSDQESVMKTVGPAHQYLNKPCDADILSMTLIRAFSLRDLLGEERLKSLVSGMRTLPSLPAIYGELMKVIQDPNASVADVGRLIAKDPAMTIKILQLVNSAFFGLGRHVSNPVDAASLLGLEILKPLALSIGIFKQFEADKLAIKEFSLDTLWSHSTHVGSIAKQIAKAEGMGSPAVEDSLLAGMLHDIGKLILVLNLPAGFKRLLEARCNTLNDCVITEKEIFGATHGAVGAYLLGLWGLPESVVEAVALHNQPALQGEKVFSVLSVVHTANALVHATDEGAELENMLDLNYLNSIGVAGRVEAWKDLASESDMNAT